MPTIRFSHKYPKLFTQNNSEPCEEAKLLEVLHVTPSKLSSEFLDYDTGGGMFEFSNEYNNHLLLIFQKDEYNIFTTIRPYSLSKEEYYKSNIGQFFDVKMKEDK